MNNLEMLADEPVAKRLKSFIERIERLEQDRDNVNEDIKAVYSEAKSIGFDAKIMRKLIKIKKIEKQKREEEHAILETYAHAIQMDLF